MHCCAEGLALQCLLFANANKRQEWFEAWLLVHNGYRMQGRWQWYGRYGHGRTGFWGEKNGIAWILTYACVMERPLRAVRRSLGHLRGLLRTFSSLQASKVTMRELGFSIYYMYSNTWVRGERVNWGGANMRVVRGGHFWQLAGSITSLATETTGGWF